MNRSVERKRVRVLNTFFKDQLHPLVRKLFLRSEETILDLYSENQCWTCQSLVASEI